MSTNAPSSELATAVAQPFGMLPNGKETHAMPTAPAPESFRRPTTGTRRRMMGAGPRARVHEAFSVLLVLGATLAGGVVLFAAYQQDFLRVLVASVPLVLLGAFSLFQARRVQRHRRLAARGNLVDGWVSDVEETTWSLAPRADSAWSFFAIPGLRLVRVRYEFQTADGRYAEGSFLVSRSSRERFAPGRRLEVFYCQSDPRENASSLVLRWYYRLRGAA